MNMSLRWADFLRDRGHDATHWKHVGDQNASDNEISAYCAKHGAVVLSQDLDFAELHALHGTSKPSVVQIRSKDLRPETIGSTVSQAIIRMESQLEKGAIITVKRSRTRLTRLPIGRLEIF
jgi:predicted nuclease of predicted toxin-antitoxin system